MTNLWGDAWKGEFVEASGLQGHAPVGLEHLVPSSPSQFHHPP